MKNIITLFVFILCAIVVQGQNSFSENYLKLRQHQEDNLMFKTIKGKELQEWLNPKEPKSQKEKKDLSFFKDVKQISVIFDMNEKHQPSSNQIDKLLYAYESLTSMVVDQMKIEVRGITKNDKIKELLISFLHQTDGDNLFKEISSRDMYFIEIIFKKPIALSDYMENTNVFTELVSLNPTEDEKDNSLIQIKYKYQEKIHSPRYDNSIPFTLTVVQVNDLYGVRRDPIGSDEYLIEPNKKKEIILYGPNPGNTYIRVPFDDQEYYCIHDKFGFIIAHGKEITPIYTSNNEEVAFFIINYEDQFFLYECPEVYQLKLENKSIRPLIGYRLKNCQSIELKDENTLECIKQDGTVELITIRKK